LRNIREPQWIFGFCLLGAYFGMGLIFGLGHIEEKTSFGLKEILTGLTFMSGAWSQYAFSRKDKDDDKQD